MFIKTIEAASGEVLRRECGVQEAVINLDVSTSSGEEIVAFRPAQESSFVYASSTDNPRMVGRELAKALAREGVQVFALVESNRTGIARGWATPITTYYGLSSVMSLLEAQISVSEYVPTAVVEPVCLYVDNAVALHPGDYLGVYDREFSTKGQTSTDDFEGRLCALMDKADPKNGVYVVTQEFFDHDGTFWYHSMDLGNRADLTIRPEEVYDENEGYLGESEVLASNKIPSTKAGVSAVLRSPVIVGR